MNCKIIDLQEILYPKKHETKYIYSYPTLNDELRDMIERSGYVHRLKLEYLKSLQFLENHKTNSVIVLPKKFEKLKNADGICSIKLKGEKNIRVLFVYTRVERQDIVILLNCFQEKDRTDYPPAIKVAKQRIIELETDQKRSK